MGYACVLQGGEVEHMAARAVGVAERITTITSYRAKTPKVYDSSYMSNLRPYSNLDDIYTQWALYRLEKMKEEVETLQQSIRTLGVDTAAFEIFSSQQSQYLQRSSAQMVPVDFHKRIIAKYGTEVYTSGPRIWKMVQEFPEFEALSMGEKSITWMPDSSRWVELDNSLRAIQMGKILEGEQGRISWDGQRSYTMGDELLRQGLREYFLDWLDTTGLYALYVLRCSK
jgi:hypothetical protein